MHSWILWTLFSLDTPLDVIESNVCALYRRLDRFKWRSWLVTPLDPDFAITKSLQYVRFEQSIERLQDRYHLCVRAQISLGLGNQIFDEGL